MDTITSEFELRIMLAGNPEAVAAFDEYRDAYNAQLNDRTLSKKYMSKVNYYSKKCESLWTKLYPNEDWLKAYRLNYIVKNK